MPTMTCPPAEQLKAFYLGKLPDDRSEELVAHVGGCSACQAELETVIDAEDSLIADLRAEDGDQSLDVEPACELGMIRALGALAEANTSGVEVERGESESLPKRIGEYEILRALGQGGMGRVYLAKHSKLGRLVALKILAGSRLGDRRASERFEAEMRAIGRLSHSNIVTAHDAREVDGVAVLVTEFVDGFDLGELLRRTGPLKIADACEIVRRVAVALQYTSDQGFVHRDVKPSNIMLSHSGEVKLLDLGLARLQYGDGEVAEFTATGQTMGTADYISPEQVKDSRTVDIRSDIYSLGATLFKLLVGRAPFADEKHSTAFAKMTAHVSMVPARVRSLRSEVPEELSQLVAAMLAKEPDGRPQQPEVVAKKLAAFAAGHNLESLAQSAATFDTRQLTHVVSQPKKTELRTQPVWYRPVKLYVAIAAGFVGMLLGLCLGIIITIKNPDGSKTVMHLPPGSKVEVSEGNDEIIPASTILPEPAMSFQTGSAPVLEFGVLLDSMTTPTETESKYGFRLIQVEKDVEVLKSAFGLGVANKDHALLSVNPKWHIRADELWGHVRETKIVKAGGSNAIELAFDESLAARMLELTTQNIGRQLAVIVQGKVASAPVIVSPSGSHAIINGAFTEEELNRIQDWLKAAKPVAMPDAVGKVIGSEVAGKAKLDSQTMHGSSVSPEEQQIASDFGAAGQRDSAIAINRQPFREVLYAFARTLTKDRTTPLPDSDLEQLAIAISRSSSSGRTNLDSIKSAIRKSWPFKGVSSVLPGVPTEANWLLSDQETGYTLIIDPQAVLPSIRTLVDELAGEPGVFDAIVKGLAKDRDGPRVDLRNLVQHLGNEMIFCAGTKTHPVSIIAFSLKNAEGVQKELQNFNDSLDEMRIVKNYLVMGKKMDVDRVTARVITAPEVRASNNVKMLGLAFANFESAYRKLPGSKNYREGGIGFKGPRTKHPFSWRVAVLPFVEEVKLFQQYDFNEPWDSEKNLKLLDKMPAVFRSPHAPSDQKVGETNYLGFAGEKSAMVDGGIPMAEIKDGTSATILLVETKRTVPWTKPEDFAFAEYADAKRAEPFDGLGLNCLMVDGTVLSLDAPVDWERLGRLVTRDGGEPFTTKP